MNYLILYFALINQCLSLIIVPNNINCKYFVPLKEIKFSKYDKYNIISKIKECKILPFINIIRNSESLCEKNENKKSPIYKSPIYKSKRIDRFERLFDNDI
jgi:hypothetical protein